MSDMPENNDELESADVAEPEAAEQPEVATEADAPSDEPTAVLPDDAPAEPEATVSAENDAATVPFSKKTVGLPAFIACVVAAVVVGVLAGHFLLGSRSVALNGTTTLTSDQLDSAIATYTYNGSSIDVTAREVLAQSGDVESQADSDGNYSVPTATDVLSYVRNQVVLKAADAQGVTVTDEEVDAYAQSVFGTSDYSTLATQYSMDESALKQTLTDSAVMSKLRETVTTTELPDSPTAPTAPSSDATDTPTAEYASYIIELAGDEWDSANNTWASTDGDYYAALSTYEITNDSATYAAAQAAYYVAQSKYSTAANQVKSEFNTYCNELLSRSTLQLGSLAI